MTEKEVDIIYLECKTGSSNKFYNIEIHFIENATSKWLVRTYYGRIGTKGQYRDKERCYSRSSAEHYRRQLVYQKEQKGYRNVTEEKLAEIERKNKRITTKEKKESVPIYLSRFSDILE